MTPKEKAKELFNNYYKLAESIEWTDKETKVKAEQFNDQLGNDVLNYWHKLAKESALIAVDEIINERFYHNGIYEVDKKIKAHIEIQLSYRLEATRNYWNEVKHEIKKL